jgi:hypothetical protein
MKNFIKWTSLIILVFLLGFILIHKQPNIGFVKIAGVTLQVEIASTPEMLKQGLSGRAGLKENEGMLFVFERPGKYSFWMKDMNFPIDIIWIGEDLKVIYIKKDALPNSFPEVFTPDKNAKYVLEVNAGFSEKNDLKEGDSVQF